MPATLDRKKEFIQWKKNVHLHPIDLIEDDLKKEIGIESFDPSLLEKGEAQRSALRSGLFNVMKKVAMLSNQSLVRNADSFLGKGGKTDKENKFVWIDDSHQATN